MTRAFVPTQPFPIFEELKVLGAFAIAAAALPGVGRHAEIPAVPAVHLAPLDHGGDGICCAACSAEAS